MKFFWKYVFPLIYGLIIYTSIRLVTDIAVGEKFWERSWEINFIEITVVVIMSYVFDWLLHYFINRFNARESNFSIQTVAFEYGMISLAGLTLTNITLFGIHYLTDDPVTWDDFAIANIVVWLYLLLYYAIARGNNFFKAYVEQKIQTEKIRNDQLDTELKFLKSQYHPHFLFNALNTIYFQMDENVDAAKKSVERFSELLRYQLYDQQQTVPISQEIEYLDNFIDLQKVRSSEKLQLKVDFDKNLNGQHVYPLLFLPLVENAFKYVGGDFVIYIAAAQYNNSVDFTVENTIPQHYANKRAGGIGLENLKRRLELLYPGKHTLTTDMKDQWFIAHLSLQLDKQA